MPVERARVLPLFKEIHLFAGMDDGQLSRVARYFTEKSYQPDEVILREGTAADSFYIIQDGDVAITKRIDNEDVQLDLLTTGDYFGEEALMLRRPRTATARAFGHVELLISDRNQFHRLLVEFPQVKTNLERIIRSRQFIRRHPFSWLNDDETVYQVRRKHIAYMLVSVIPPVLVLLLVALPMLAFGLLRGLATTQGIVLVVLAGIFLLIGLAWLAWNIIDWSNDYYIVTSQRVVWIEQVIWLYESREEAPLDSMRGINVRTTLLGRILGYGDVLVSTYTDEVVLRAVSDPYQMEAIIREFWKRVQQMTTLAKKAETEQDVLRILGREAPPPTAPVPAPAAPARSRLQRERAPGDVRELGFGEKYFGNFLRLRFEDGDTITYRKHWLVLLGKTWKPLALFVLLLVALGVCGWFSLQGRLPAGTMLLATVLVVVFLIPTSGWWLYNYLDWLNDIYQITKDSIFDIERKPLGTETRTSAPLDRIISLGHERAGFIGYIFNVGNVVVNVGDAKLTFNGVYEPARVQQDVFKRMRQQQARKQRAEVTREQERILTLLQIYHQKVNDNGPENE